jgi:hypothetical protein
VPGPPSVVISLGLSTSGSTCSSAVGPSPRSSSWVVSRSRLMVRRLIAGPCRRGCSRSALFLLFFLVICSIPRSLPRLRCRYGRRTCAPGQAAAVATLGWRTGKTVSRVTSPPSEHSYRSLDRRFATVSGPSYRRVQRGGTRRCVTPEMGHQWTICSFWGVSCSVASFCSTPTNTSPACRPWCLMPRRKACRPRGWRSWARACCSPLAA